MGKMYEIIRDTSQMCTQNEDNVKVLGLAYVKLRTSGHRVGSRTGAGVTTTVAAYSYTASSCPCPYPMAACREFDVSCRLG